MLRKLGWKTGVGLVAANMIGAGVFLSAGFMAQEMPPWQILLAWAVGTVLALAGARAYAEVARLVPRSGGEYRYLSELLHPALGYLAGWASLLVGFSAPIAIDAVAATQFFGAGDVLDGGKLVAVALVALLTLFHLADLTLSASAQNILVGIKIALVVIFVVAGLALGSNAWPEWSPPGAPPGGGDQLRVFMVSLFYIAFAFSGWNAAIYAAEEFERPSRDVPRAMMIGCAAVGALYLIINWVIVANITPADAAAVFTWQEDRVTLAHVVADNVGGAGAARVMSVFIGLAFISAMSAMIFIGPRVYAAMARDGFLPEALAGRDGKPPAGSVLLQGGIAVALIYVQSIRSVLSNVGAILVLFSMLTAAGLLVARLSGRRVPAVAVGAAGLYAAASLAMLAFGLSKLENMLLVWLAVVLAVALVAYAITARGPRSPRGPADRRRRAR